MAVFFAAAILASGPSFAASGSAAIVVDAKTGQVLYSSNADSRRYPASLTKMMTLYMVFEALDRGEITLDSKVKMSKFAASQPPSKLGVKAGNSITVREAILSLVTRSANDVATALGERLAGSEKTFARRMTDRARQLGMSRTTFRNAHGLPNSEQVTTARDMALLGRALQQHYPEYFKFFSTPSFSFRGAKIANHNRLLGRVEGVNGIKTGYTRASGYNLVSSVDRNGRQIVAVVLGGKSGASRDARMRELIADYLPKAARNAEVAWIPKNGGSTRLVAMGPIPMPRLRPTVETLPNEPVVAVAAAVAAPLPLPALAPAPVVAEVAETVAETIAPAVEAVAEMPVAEPVAEIAAVAAEVVTPEVAPIEPLALAPVENEGAFAANSIATLIGANSIFALEAVDEGDARFEDDDVVTAAIAPAVAPAPIADIETAEPVAEPSSYVDLNSWKIQLAATPTEESAKNILETAQEKASTILADAAPYTEPVKAGSGTLYRARFAGFADKDEARAACAYLAKQKFNCLAIAN